MIDQLIEAETRWSSLPTTAAFMAAHTDVVMALRRTMWFKRSTSKHYGYVVPREVRNNKEKGKNLARDGWPR